MRQLDLCSGVGAGFGIAGLRAGWELVGICENDNYCTDILSKRFPGVYNYGDVRGLRVQDIRGIDVITASAPCQPFSINGKRLGATDERDCFPAVLESITRIQPKFFCIENVTGLLTCPNYPGQPTGSYFRGVVTTIDSSGYDAEWVCVCSGHFAAPFLRQPQLPGSITTEKFLEENLDTEELNQETSLTEKFLEESSSTDKSNACGCLYQYIENKKLKNGTIVSYPRVEGERDKHNYLHWRWGYSWEEKIDGQWKNRSLGVSTKIVTQVANMIYNGNSVQNIREFIALSKKYRKSDK
jgi:DNA (cytosine-5)-methyltransferase 1